MNKPEAEFTPMLLVDFAEAARQLSISRALLYSMSADGRLGPAPLHIGRRALLNRRELSDWCDCGLPNREKWQEIKKRNET